MEEIWKDIKGYEGRYQVSSFGNVRSLNYRQTGNTVQLKPFKGGNHYKTYLYVSFKDYGVKHNYRVHRLVADAFIPNPENKPIVQHLDGNTMNNNVLNLGWCDQEDNMGNEVTKDRISRSPVNKSNSKKAVCCFDAETNVFVGEWPCAKDVSYAFGCVKNSISQCCRGLIKSLKGMKFFYKDQIMLAKYPCMHIPHIPMQDLGYVKKP